jgi:hypothetical protein
VPDAHGAAEAGSDEQRFEGVYADQLSAVFWLLREKLPRVFAANRFFEERTGLHNQAGVNNLVDALSHMGTLVEHADRLDHAAQAQQVTLLEDHLRRSMMEAFEQLVKLYLGKAAQLWERHTHEVRPLILKGELRGVANPDELERLRVEVRDLLHKGRDLKRSPDWDDWERGTDLFIRACDAVDELYRRLEEGIAAAERYQVIQRRRRAHAAATSAVGALAAGAGFLLDRVI